MLPLLAAAIVVVGAVGPWLHYRGEDFEAYDTDRTIVSVLAGLAAASVCLAAYRSRPPTRVGLLICALNGIAFSGYHLLDLPLENAGWGLWVAFGGSLLLLAAVVWRVATRADAAPG